MRTKTSWLDWRSGLATWRRPAPTIRTWRQGHGAHLAYDDEAGGTAGGVTMRFTTWLHGVCLAGALALLLSGCESAGVSQPTATPTQTPIASVTPLAFVSCPTVGEYPHHEAQGVVRSTNGDSAEGQLWVWFQSLTSEHYGQ